MKKLCFVLILIILSVSCVFASGTKESDIVGVWRSVSATSSNEWSFTSTGQYTHTLSFFDLSGKVSSSTVSHGNYTLNAFSKITLNDSTGEKYYLKVKVYEENGKKMMYGQFTDRNAGFTLSKVK